MNLGRVDELIGKALRDGLDVAERGLTGASGEQEDGLKLRSIPFCKQPG
jgi:hypothetical protein